MFETWCYLPSLFLELYPNVLLRFEFLCISISDPGGAIGVASKWYSPSIAAHADSSELCIHALKILTLIYICTRGLHHYAIGNVGGNNANIDFVHKLYVWIDRSDGFPRCISRGVYC